MRIILKNECIYWKKGETVDIWINKARELGLLETETEKETLPLTKNKNGTGKIHG